MTANLAKRTCSIDDADCTDKGKITRGWCQVHYRRFLQTGDPLIALSSGRRALPPGTPGGR